MLGGRYVASTAFAALKKELEGDVAAMKKTLEDATKKLEDQVSRSALQDDAPSVLASTACRAVLLTVLPSTSGNRGSVQADCDHHP